MSEEVVLPKGPATRVVPSRARRVTLFEDRAEVTRTAAVELPPGATWVALAGVSPFIDERSVQARASTMGGFAPQTPREGGAHLASSARATADTGEGSGDPPRVLSARVRWHAHREGALGREEIEALEAELRAAQLRAAEADDALGRASAAEARARGLRARWIEGAATVPRGARRPEVAAAWRDALASVERAVTEALAAAALARADRERASDDFARAEARRSLGREGALRHEAHVEVEVEGRGNRRVEIEVTYRVPGALWRPEHLVRLAGPLPAQGATAPLEVITLATAWQRTGEAWDGVEVSFSTARPARQAGPPPLADDVLVSRRKTDWERSRVEVGVREQAVTTAGLDRGARAVDEMPGVDDGGEPLQLAPRERVSIASDGRPFRVEVARASLEAKIERVVFPEIAPVAHLRATATLVSAGQPGGEAAGPLLAGPLRVARGKSLVGLGRIGFVGRGEPFEIGLGADDGVRVRRSRTEERETAAVLGTQRVRRKVEVFLVNLSDEPRRIQVTERVPVSEIEDVEIHVTDAGGFRPEGKDGLFRREVDLPAHATQELFLAYEIRAGAKVVLPP